MSRVMVEVVFEIPDALATEPKEILWLVENADYKILKFNHINRIHM